MMASRSALGGANFATRPRARTTCMRMSSESREFITKTDCVHRRGHADVLQPLAAQHCLSLLQPHIRHALWTELPSRIDGRWSRAARCGTWKRKAPSTTLMMATARTVFLSTAPLPNDTCAHSRVPQSPGISFESTRGRKHALLTTAATKKSSCLALAGAL